MDILKNFHLQGYVYGQLKPSNITIKGGDSKLRLSLINCNSLHYIHKVDKKECVEKTFLMTEKHTEKEGKPSSSEFKSNYFTSTQILKKERIDYKTDLESLFYVLFYLFNNGKVVCQDLTDKKLLFDQVCLSINKEKLTERLGRI